MWSSLSPSDPIIPKTGFQAEKLQVASSTHHTTEFTPKAR